jgi:hypothetical protein
VDSGVAILPLSMLATEFINDDFPALIGPRNRTRASFKYPGCSWRFICSIRWSWYRKIKVEKQSNV